MSSSYRIELDKWLAGLDIKADSVLDIGGSQLQAKGRTRSWDVKNYHILDLPQPHKGSPKPDIEMDINTQSIADYYTEYVDQYDYEVIFCLEVFDYVWDPRNALKLIKGFLNDGGSAWVSFPSFYPLHQPIEDDALRYMPGGIQKLADSVRLTIKEWIPRRTETDAIYQAFRTERMRCAKGEDHNISGWIVRFEK